MYVYIYSTYIKMDVFILDLSKDVLNFYDYRRHAKNYFTELHQYFEGNGIKQVFDVDCGRRNDNTLL